MPLFEDPEIYRNVLECMQNGVYLVDRNEKIQFWNEGAERITGYLRQAVLGHSCREFFAPQEQDGKGEVCELGGALRAVLRDGRPVITALTLRHKDGHQVSLRVRSVPVRDRNGVITGAAESFDEDRRAIYSERRHNKLAGYGCFDESTGVLSRAYIETHIRECLTTFAEHRIPFSVLVVEIDGVPQFRSSYGASAAAAIVRLEAQTIESSIRPTDFLGHCSENRFLAVLSECSAAEVKSVAERLLRMVRNTRFKWWGDSISLTASFGASSAKDGDTEHSLIARADVALSESIMAGRNRVTVHV
ncbi:MAG: sensor domain-containing diguanylate cyclase [Candidatus Acidiferrales bacterium]